MKRLKFIFVFVAVALIAAAFSVNASAKETVHTCGIYSYTVSDSKATIVGVGDVTSAHLVIPDNLDGYPVVNIGEKALYHDNIREITFPETVRFIEKEAYSRLVDAIHIGSIEAWVQVEFGYTFYPFYGVDALYLKGEPVTDLVIPDGVKEINAKTFAFLKSLESVTIPESVERIGQDAFSFTDLEAVYVDSIEAWINTCTAMEKTDILMWHPMAYAKNFYVDGKLLTELVIPEGITEIPAYTFYNVASIESITFNSCVTRIGDHAFSDCTYIKDFYLPDIETWLGSDASFKGKNRSFENIYFGGKLANELIIPEGITELPENAFANWKGLKSVTFPESLRSVGKNAFLNCDAVENVFAPSLGYWLSIDFASAEANPLCPLSKLYLGGEELCDLEVTENVKAIKKFAFSDYAGLVSLTVTGKEVTIDSGAFRGNSNLSLYADSLEFWLKVTFNSVSANPMYYGAKLFINGENPTELEFPESTGLIPDYAFYGCKELEKVSIPVSATIGYRAFHKSGVAEVILGSLTDKAEPVKDIKFNTFDAFESLEKITLGYGVRAIDKNAFNGCKNLKNIYLNDRLEKIDNYAFMDSGLVEISIPSSVKYVGESAFENCNELTDLTLGDFNPAGEKMQIMDRAFYGCSSLTTINFNPGIGYVGQKVFDGAKALDVMNVNDLYSYLAIDFYLAVNFENSNPSKFANKLYIEGEEPENIVIPEGTKAICKGAFYGCEKLKTVEFPEGLVYIGKEAFYRCENLQNFTLPETLEEIGLYAFLGCSSITELELPKRLSILGGSAFDDCKSLELVYMHQQHFGIGKYCFDGCENMKLVLYSGTQEEWLKLIETNKKETGLENVAVFFSYSTDYMFAPENFTAKNGENEITLSWKEINGVTGYRIYRKEGDSWKSIKTTLSNSYTIKDLPSGTKYSFAVKAYIRSGALVLWSPNYSTIDTATMALKPDEIISNQNSSAIRLTWTKSTGATGYRIYYRTGNNWKVCLSTTSKTTHTFTGLKAGAKYTFAVRPYIKTGSNVVWSGYTTCIASTIPKAPTIKVASPSSKTATLSWNNVGAVDGYRVYYKVNGGSYKAYKTYSTAQNLTFRNLTKGAEYTFVVRAGIKTSVGVVWSSYTPATVRIS